MTPYRFDNKETKERWSRKKIALVSAGIVLSVGLVVFVLAPAIRNMLRGPAWLANTVTQVAQDRTAIESSIAETAQQLELETLRQENDALRKELGYQKDTTEIILAEIIAKPNRSLYNSLIINRGTDDGIIVGQRVTVQGTIGLGEIAAVSTNTATVMLYSGPQFNGDLVIKNEKNISVPATGKGSGNFEIHIPREVVIADGDMLALPAYQNMIVGVVKSVQFDPRDPFQTVLARTPVNVQELRFVEVVK